jgi:sulfur carrier protein ThiS
MESEPQSVIVVHVKLLGFLKRWCNQPGLDIEIPAGATVHDLLDLLANRLGSEFRQAVLDRNGDLHGGVELILDGQEIPPRRISGIQVCAESDLTIIPIIVGGR